MNRLVEQTVQYTLYAGRVLRRAPFFAAGTIISIALGIGANVAIFSVVNSVLFEAFPAPHSENLFLLESATRTDDFEAVSDQEFEQYKRQSRSFQGLTAYECGITNLIDSRDTTIVRRCQVRLNFWDVMGQLPELGRSFSTDESASGGAEVVISDRLWHSQLGGDASVLGRSVMLDGKSYTVVGIMPPDFDFPWRADIWSPRLGAAIRIGVHGVIGRLNKRTSVIQAQAELQVICDRIAQLIQPEDPLVRVRLVSIQDFIGGSVRKPFLMLLGAVGLLLLICCSNAANLELARAVYRQYEMAIRVSLGANRLSIIGQLLVESLVQALIGGIVGLFLGWCMMRAMIPLLVASEVPRAGAVHFDFRVFAFAVTLSVFAGITFGLPSAIEVTRRGFCGLLQSGTRIAGRSHPVRELLVTIEVAVAVVLLVGGGLLLKSFARLNSVDPGFDVRDRTAMTLFFPDDRPVAQLVQFDYALLDQIRSITVVDSVALVNWIPFGHAFVEGTFWGDATAQPQSGIVACRVGVSSDYFKIMGMRLLRGRPFYDREGETGTSVAIVSRSFARRLWPNKDPIGERLTTVNAGPDPKQWRLVVGVVDDVVQEDLSQSPSLAVYEPLFQLKDPLFLAHVVFVVHSSAGREAVSSALMGSVHQLDRTLPIFSVESLEKLVSDSVLHPHLYARAMSAYSFLGLLLTMTGVYGVLRLIVSQRTREIGVRITFGASRRDIVEMVLVRSMKSVFVGVVCGLGAASGLTQILRKELFGVSPFDIATFIGAPLLVIAISLLASYLPARKAARLNPVAALREG